MFGIVAIVLGVIAILVALDAGSKANQLAERVRALEEGTDAGGGESVEPVDADKGADTPGG